MLISLIFSGLGFYVFFILRIKSIKKYKLKVTSGIMPILGFWTVKNLEWGG